MSLRHPLHDRKRIEHDALGSMEVPFGALYGIQTARAMQNFPVSGVSIGRFPDLVIALALIKKAAARVNHRLGGLPAEKAELIGRVCDEIIAGQHLDHFPVDVLQGGAGTSTNMNINEVIANRGLELMGRGNGEYAYLHPNDDVNRSQSTNDVYPTAIRLALLTAVPRLQESLLRLSAAFEGKGRAFSKIRKLGRTHLQDAVPMTLGAEMTAYGVTIREDVDRLEETLALLHQINLGGTAIGTGVATAPGYREAVVLELSTLSDHPLTPAKDLVEASSDVGALVHLSGVFRRVATKLSKIASDLRLLSSGSRGGLGEIKLPPVQPSSSIMPGKVDPVIPEMVNQVAFQVIGMDLTISFAAEGGQLQLNAFEPVIAYGLLQAVTLLHNGTTLFRTRCVEGIEADTARCHHNLASSTANFAELVPQLGYERACALVNEMLAAGKTWNEIASAPDFRDQK